MTLVEELRVEKEIADSQQMNSHVVNQLQKNTARTPQSQTASPPLVHQTPPEAIKHKRSVNKKNKKEIFCPSVFYIHSPELARMASLLPKVPHRALVVSDLIRAYGLDLMMVTGNNNNNNNNNNNSNNEKSTNHRRKVTNAVQVEEMEKDQSLFGFDCSPFPASGAQICSFHERDYVQVLKIISQSQYCAEKSPSSVKRFFLTANDEKVNSSNSLHALSTEMVMRSDEEVVGEFKRLMVEGKIDSKLTGEEEEEELGGGLEGGQHRIGLIERVLDHYGLIDDCPLFYGAYQYAQWVCGGSIRAADAIIHWHRQFIEYRRKKRKMDAIEGGVESEKQKLQKEEELDDKKNGSTVVESCVIGNSELCDGRTGKRNEANPFAAAPVGIHWSGGWHHAGKNAANGFCYFNDIVLCILRLLHSGYSRVLYIDLDLHHGDQVERAFYYSNRVFTLSIHKYVTGFYPGTGGMDAYGAGAGKYFNLNVPLNVTEQQQMNDDIYWDLFQFATNRIGSKFRPQAVVVQCGADGMCRDPFRAFDLTPPGLGRCVERILSWKLPTVFLGGGGYDNATTARLWTYLTGIIIKNRMPSCRKEKKEHAIDCYTLNSSETPCQLETILPDDIPENRFFHLYGPDFTLNFSSTKTSASASQETRRTKDMIQRIKNNIHKLTERINI
eukprot:Nk52_evm14s212 gene=Nk52_evmTU14s212